MLGALWDLLFGNGGGATPDVGGIGGSGHA